MSKDQHINELTDQIIDRQEAINELLNDSDFLTEEMIIALQKILDNQKLIINQLISFEMHKK